MKKRPPLRAVRRQEKDVRTVTHLVREAIDGILSSQPHVLAKLSLKWPDVVGPSWSRITYPLKIRYTQKNDLSQGTLYVCVPHPAHAFELKMHAPQMLARINLFLNRRAIHTLVFKHEPERFAALSASKYNVTSLQDVRANQMTPSNAASPSSSAASLSNRDACKDAAHEPISPKASGSASAIACKKKIDASIANISDPELQQALLSLSRHIL